MAGAMAILAVSMVLVMASPVGASEFGDPTPGHRVYDRSGLLTPAEVADLEQRAASVTAAGAPTVVYVRRQDRDQEQTRNDASSLMDAWRIESSGGARDGLVIFVNLETARERHGQVALYSGQLHARISVACGSTMRTCGRLPRSELDRIYEDVMKPDLAAGRTAAGLAAGLDAAAHDLAYGPPPPGDSRAAALARGPFNVVAVVVSIAIVAVVLPGALRRHTRVTPGPRVQGPPGQLPPAIAGALVTGSIGAAQTEATLLDLARRGALEMIPDVSGSMEIRLLRADVAATAYERETLNLLSELAEEGTIAAPHMWKVAGALSRTEPIIEADLTSRGWWERTTYRRELITLIVSTCLASALVLCGVILWIVGIEPLVIIGILALTASVAAAWLIPGAPSPRTSAATEEAARWLGYRDGLTAMLKDSGVGVDLDIALPYAVGFGVAWALKEKMREASRNGYSPTWFRGPSGSLGDAGFYPYWVAIQANALPSTTSSTTGAGSSGGASGGGAAAGGGF